jgi:hypothetical protein
MQSQEKEKIITTENVIDACNKIISKVNRDYITTISLMKRAVKGEKCADIVMEQVNEAISRKLNIQYNNLNISYWESGPGYISTLS